MIYANVGALANQAMIQSNKWKDIAKHLKGILKADAVDGVDLSTQQKADALAALNALETAAADTADYLAVKNSPDPVE